MITTEVCVQKKDIDRMHKMLLEAQDDSPETYIKGLGCVTFGTDVLAKSNMTGRGKPLLLNQRAAYAVIGSAVYYSRWKGEPLSFTQGENFLLELCQSAKAFTKNRLTPDDVPDVLHRMFESWHFKGYQFVTDV
ncbi:uncharacterized protein LOC132201704 [Neocloeon triangulifer]|uniref:uncharacterized protein LOC132201704 n=1 Tax=Neocloeon triangulifer TaxID=2078957 RepID=UPI00286ED385|nr:uncharacterized protein LOC132201704 [Neocloeon triangulifer]